MGRRGRLCSPGCSGLLLISPQRENKPVQSLGDWRFGRRPRLRCRPHFSFTAGSAGKWFLSSLFFSFPFLIIFFSTNTCAISAYFLLFCRFKSAFICWLSSSCPNLNGNVTAASAELGFQLKLPSACGSALWMLFVLLLLKCHHCCLTESLCHQQMLCPPRREKTFGIAVAVVHLLHILLSWKCVKLWLEWKENGIFLSLEDHCCGHWSVCVCWLHTLCYCK